MPQTPAKKSILFREKMAKLNRKEMRGIFLTDEEEKTIKPNVRAMLGELREKEHCIQYAVISSYDMLVSVPLLNTDKLSDSDIFKSLKHHPLLLKVKTGLKVARLNRCPVCEEYTTSGGELRKDIECPAISHRLGMTIY